MEVAHTGVLGAVVPHGLADRGSYRSGRIR